MNLNQLINMVVRIVTRRVVNAGITRGLGLVARKGKAAGRKGAAIKSAESQKHDSRETAKKARRAAQVTRRLGR